MHPFCGLALLIPTGLLALRLSSLWALAGVLITLLLWLAVTCAERSSRLRQWALVLVPLALGPLLVHGHWLRTDLPLETRLEALQPALCLWLRLGIVLAATLYWLASIRLEQLVLALFASRLPPGAAYLLVSPLLLKEQLTRRLSTIGEAQRARGMDTHTSWLRRWYHIMTLSGPLIVWTLTDVEERAAALESRAFRSHASRTTLNAPLFTRRDRGLVTLALLCTLLVAVSFLWP